MKANWLSILFWSVVVCLGCAGPGRFAEAEKFSCEAKSIKGARLLSATTSFHDGAGTFGWDLNTAPTAFGQGACSDEKPFFFSAAASDGNYQVTLVAMGEEGTLKAFVHYPANTFPDQKEELKDDTHFNSYGAYELARAVVQSVRDQNLSLKKFLKQGIPVFDPAKPDGLSMWTLPPSPNVSIATPDGR